MDSLRVPENWQKSMGLVALGTKAKASFEDPAKQDTTRAGDLKWRVSVTATDGETFEVTVTGPEPKVTRFKPVWLEGLTLGGSKNGLWWAATGATATQEPGNG